MKIDRTHLDVVCCVVMLCVVVSKVGFSRCPFNGELALVNSIRDPVKPHVHCLGAFKLVVTVGKTTGSGIIGGDDGGATLFMAKFREDLKTASLPLWKSAPTLASVAEAMTFLIMRDSMWMGPLGLISGDGWVLLPR